MVPLNIQGQDNSTLREIYTQAESDYGLGRFDQALDSLQGNINAFHGNLKQNVFRLIALCYLAQDDMVQSENYAKLLLYENPYYTSVQDPIRFEEIVSRLKLGRTATVTTASSKAESINETPVPVTIITAEMIEMLGYNKSLNQILAAYVPGITEVASYNLDNIAMHGAYSSGQEKILIMENGHRLNARSTNIGRTDYAISTTKIDHIEVLRGPASSLYGNVALTAVVNIITKEGTSINSISAQYGYGSWNTHKADFLAGTHYMNADIFVWASLYNTKGEDRYVSPSLDEYYTDAYRTDAPLVDGGNAHINKYSEKPSFDLGINFTFKDFSLMFSHKSGKKAPQYSILGHTYNYDAYRSFNGQKAGYGIDENHADIGYKKSWGNFSLNTSIYGDWYSFTDYTVASDGMLYPEFNDDGTPMKDDDGNTITTEWLGAYQIYAWKEMTLGATMRGDYNYKLGGMTGNILAGMQFEYFSLYDTYGMMGENFDEVKFVIKESKNPILTGRENSMSFFLQDKHYFTNKLILNAGLRFDSKYRANNSRINALSPRVALIYTPKNNFSLKLSYSRSFVDAPYFYRRNTDNSYMGGEDLKPEYLNAIQFDVLGVITPLHLTYDINLFYNKFTDMIYAIPGADLEDVKYRNSGKLEIMGAEMDLRYNHKRFRTDLTASYSYALSAQDYYFKDNHIYAVPNFVTNGVISYNLLDLTSHRLWITSNIRFSTNSYVRVLNTEMYEDEKISSNIIFDLGTKYQIGKHVTLQVNCENLFDKTTHMSGATMTVMPWYKPGRTIMANVKLKL